MVFSSLHNVKELTFNWEKKKRRKEFASCVFPFLTLSILEFRDKTMQNQIRTSETAE